MSSFWWNFHHWLHWKLSKWQLPVQPVMKISSKWRHFRFSEGHRRHVVSLGHSDFTKMHHSGVRGYYPDSNKLVTEPLLTYQEGGSLIAPMALAHPLHPIDNRSRNKRRNLWVGRCVSSWWPWFPSRDSVLIYMYIYICVHSLYEFCYRSYIQRECHSVLAKLHPITFYRGMRGSWSECHFVFSLVYQLCLALW